jgi:hypothetical protein
LFQVKDNGQAGQLVDLTRLNKLLNDLLQCERKQLNLEVRSFGASIQFILGPFNIEGSWLIDVRFKNGQFRSHVHLKLHNIGEDVLDSVNFASVASRGFANVSLARSPHSHMREVTNDLLFRQPPIHTFRDHR